MSTEDEGSIASILLSLEEEGYEDILVLEQEQFQSALTERRREIIDILKEGHDLSVSELAKRLDRKKSAVSRDLGKLYEYNVIDFGTEGRKKIPHLKHEVMIVKPVILNQPRDNNTDERWKNEGTKRIDPSSIPDRSYEYGSEALKAIEDLRSKSNQSEAVDELRDISKSSPEDVAFYLPLLGGIIKDNPELVGPVADIVETISATHPDKIPESLYVTLLNEGMDVWVEEKADLNNKDGREGS